MKRPLLVSALLAWALPSHVLPLTIYPKEKRSTPKIVEIERHQLLNLLGKERSDESGQTGREMDSVNDEAIYSHAEQQYPRYYSTPEDYNHYLTDNEVTVNLNGFPRDHLLLTGVRNVPYQLFLTGQPARHSHFAPNYTPLPPSPPVMPFGLISHRLPAHYQDENLDEYANRMRQHQHLAVQSLNLGYYTQTGQDQHEPNGMIYNSPFASLYMNIQKPNDPHSVGAMAAYGTQPTSPVYHYYPVPKGTFSGQPIRDGRIKSADVPVNHKDVTPSPPQRQPIVVPEPPLVTTTTPPAHKHDHDGDDYDDEIKYDFGYRVVDEGSGLEFGKTETKKDGLTQGSYHVLLPDGRLQVVKYWSDHTGYHTDISYSIPGTH